MPGVFIQALVTGRREKVERHASKASMGAGMKYTRFYADETGESHIEDVDVELNPGTSPHQPRRCTSPR